jgi:hypothetical protein
MFVSSLGLPSAILLATAVLTLLLAGNTQANTITIMSGNAPIGSQDPDVSVSGMVSPEQAWVVAPFDPGIAWFNPISASQWVAPVQNYQGLVGQYYYYFDFTLPAVSTIQFSLSYGVDDTGDQSNDAYGFLLNGVQQGTVATFYYPNTFNTTDVNLFSAGTNTLVFPVFNLESIPNPTGLDFYGTITYTPAPVPEPSSLLLLASGVISMTAFIRTKTRVHDKAVTTGSIMGGGK